MSLLLLAMLCCQETFQQPGEGKPRQYCGVDDPLNALPWLRAKVDTVTTQYDTMAGLDVFVVSATYHEQQVFFVDICCPFCMVAAPEVRNCQGDVIGTLADGIPADKVVNRTVIWKTDNGVCEGS